MTSWVRLLFCLLSLLLLCCAVFMLLLSLFSSSPLLLLSSSISAPFFQLNPGSSSAASQSASRAALLPSEQEKEVRDIDCVRLYICSSASNFHYSFRPSAVEPLLLLLCFSASSASCASSAATVPWVPFAFRPSSPLRFVSRFHFGSASRDITVHPRLEDGAERSSSSGYRAAAMEQRPWSSGISILFTHKCKDR